MPSSQSDKTDQRDLFRGALEMMVLRCLMREPMHGYALVFLYRHPRTLLTNEQLAGFVGYGMKEIAKALDIFSEAGLLERATQRSTHAARMYSLVLDGPGGGGLKLLLKEARTWQGRQDILAALDPERQRPEAVPTPELRLVKRG